MRTLLVWIAAAYVFGSFYVMVEQKESVRRSGETIFLVLAPLDPRSPFQGDYMALNYEITNEMNHARWSTLPPTGPVAGAFVVRVDEQGVGHFVRVYQGGPLAMGEHLLKFHHHDWRTVIGAETYFIPEGSGPSFAQAAYGELKVAPDGTALLVALCDKNRQRLVATEPKASR